MSDMRALKCWMASSLLCCSLSLSISLVCSDRAFWTSRSLSLRLASMRACRSNSRSLSMSTFCKVEHRVGCTSRGNVTSTLHLCYPNVSKAQHTHSWDNLTLRRFDTTQNYFFQPITHEASLERTSPWPVSPCNVCKVLPGVQSFPQLCIEGLSPASLSLCSTAGLLQHVGHLRVQRNRASPGNKTEAQVKIRKETNKI